jgi:hypothetical protein
MKAEITSHTNHAMLQHNVVAPVNALNPLGSTCSKDGMRCAALTDWTVAHLRVMMIQSYRWYKQTWCSLQPEMHPNICLFNHIECFIPQRRQIKITDWHPPRVLDATHLYSTCSGHYLTAIQRLGSPSERRGPRVGCT